MSTVLHAQITRKKAVPRKFPDSFRVISIDAELHHQQTSLSYPRKPALPAIPRAPRDYPTDDRYHKPHPYDCGFLRANPKWINEPVCVVNTRTLSGPSGYRASGAFFSDEQVPTSTGQTIFKSDYGSRDDKPRRLTRYGSNPNTAAASGIVPGTQLDDCRQRDDRVREQISYEHQYDARKDPNYPVRTKRHGSFVWKYPQPCAGPKQPESVNAVDNNPTDGNTIAADTTTGGDI